MITLETTTTSLDSGDSGYCVDFTEQLYVNDAPSSKDDNLGGSIVSSSTAS